MWPRPCGRAALSPLPHHACPPQPPCRVLTAWGEAVSLPSSQPQRGAPQELLQVGHVGWGHHGPLAGDPPFIGTTDPPQRAPQHTGIPLPPPPTRPGSPPSGDALPQRSLPGGLRLWDPPVLGDGLGGRGERARTTRLPLQGCSGRCAMCPVCARCCAPSQPLGSWVPAGGALMPSSQRDRAAHPPPAHGEQLGMLV